MPIYGEPEPPYPERYAKGVWLFNHRHFFECHEILEELWLESIATPKVFFQMIIHAAVCFVHWENGNRKGVLSLEHTTHLKADEVKGPDGPVDAYMGLDIARLRADMKALVDPLRADMDLALPPYADLVTPQLQVSGFEPIEVDYDELLVLSREVEKEDDE